MVRFIELSLLFHKSLRIPSVFHLFSFLSLSDSLTSYFWFQLFFSVWLSVLSHPTRRKFLCHKAPTNCARMIYGASAAPHFAFDRRLCVHNSSRDDATKPIFPPNCSTLLLTIWLISVRENFPRKYPTKPIVYGFYHRWMVNFSISRSAPSSPACQGC